MGSKSSTFIGDKIIRDSFVSNFLLPRHSAEKVFSEVGLELGFQRVDLLAVGQALHGYEIKSDLDTLTRLPEQAVAYSSAFERVTLVTTAKHIHAAARIVPDWWEILRVDPQSSEMKFRMVRRGRRNPDPLPAAIVKLLWKDELLQILKDTHASNHRAKMPKVELWEIVANSFSCKTLLRLVRETITCREGWKSPLLSR